MGCQLGSNTGLAEAKFGTVRKQLPALQGSCCSKSSEVTLLQTGLNSGNAPKEVHKLKQKYREREES